MQMRCSSHERSKALQPDFLDIFQDSVTRIVPVADLLLALSHQYCAQFTLFMLHENANGSLWYVFVMLYLLTCISSLQVSLSRHEDPLAEFDDDPATLDSELQDLVPSLHPEDTPHIPYRGVLFNEDEMVKRSKEFYQLMKKRRSVRHYSSKSVPKEVVENIIHTAGAYVCVRMYSSHSGMGHSCH